MSEEDYKDCMHHMFNFNSLVKLKVEEAYRRGFSHGASQDLRMEECEEFKRKVLEWRHELPLSEVIGAPGTFLEGKTMKEIDVEGWKP